MHSKAISISRKKIEDLDPENVDVRTVVLIGKESSDHWKAFRLFMGNDVPEHFKELRRLIDLLKEKSGHEVRFFSYKVNGEDKNDHSKDDYYFEFEDEEANL